MVQIGEWRVHLLVVVGEEFAEVVDLVALHFEEFEVQERLTAQRQHLQFGVDLRRRRRRPARRRLCRHKKKENPISLDAKKI